MILPRALTLTLNSGTQAGSLGSFTSKVEDSSTFHQHVERPDEKKGEKELRPAKNRGPALPSVHNCFFFPITYDQGSGIPRCIAREL